MEIAQYQENRGSRVHGKGLAVVPILVVVTIVVSGGVSLKGIY